MTRAVTAEPPRGKVTCSRLTIRPSSSTSRSTVRPPKPVWDSVTSTSTVEPSSTRLGATTRETSMSLRSRGRPTPTVYTGVPAAFSVSRASPSSAGAESAPSESRTRPESGSPASSSLAATSASPSRLSARPNRSCSVDSIRSALRPKARSRTWKRSARRSSIEPDSPDRASSTAPARVPSAAAASSGMAMLRESSTTTPTNVSCGTTVDRTRAGCSRQKTRTPIASDRNTGGNQRRRSAPAVRSAVPAPRRR